MTFKPYIPGQRYPGPAQNKEFRTLSELEAIPHVHEAMEKPGFYKLCLEMEGEPTLLAEYNYGGHWSVVGYIVPPVFQIGLPIFRYRSLAQTHA